MIRKVGFELLVLGYTLQVTQGGSHSVCFSEVHGRVLRPLKYYPDIAVVRCSDKRVHCGIVCPANWLSSRPLCATEEAHPSRGVPVNLDHEVLRQNTTDLEESNLE